jgi:hypothetical protein
MEQPGLGMGLGTHPPPPPHSPSLAPWRPHTGLLVVLDPHAHGVDQDGHHYAPAEVLAVHDAP